MPKYTVYEANNKIIVVSSFAGRPVRGVAKCSPEDKFDRATGIKLAQARCDMKVAEKRFARALKRHSEAVEKMNAALRENKKMGAYVDDAYTDLEKTRAYLYELETSL